MSIKMRKNDFDAVAPIYDALAGLVFMGAIKRSQIALLPEISDAKSVLIVGGGTGWFLAELLARTPIERVLYVELSSDMLEKSRRQVERRVPQHLGRVEFRLGTEESVTEEDGLFDVVATNFFLACFGDENCARVASGLRKKLAPGGRWLFVDFEVPSKGIRRLAAQVLFKVMFTFFNVVSSLEAKGPPNYGYAFGPLGMQSSTETRFYGDMIRAKVLTATAVSVVAQEASASAPMAASS